MDGATEVRLGVLEREITILRAANKEDAEFRGELRSFMSEMRLSLRERASDINGLERRMEAAEKGIQELERFKAKILGAVAVAGLLGGGTGALAQVLFRLLA